MTAARRQQIALASLAPVLAAALWWGFRSSPAPTPRATHARTTASREKGAGVAPTVPAVRRVERGDAAAAGEESGRDPFRFGTGRRGGGSGEPSAESGRPASAPVVPAVPAGSVAPSGPPPPPPIPLKLIGLVRQEGPLGRIAVLSDSRGVYHGREGDLIEGRYRVLRISGDAVDVAYADGRGRQTLRLSGS